MLEEVIRDVLKILRRALRPAKLHLPARALGQQLFHSRTDFIVAHSFATIDLGEAFFHLAQKPFVVIDEALHRLANERFRVAPLFRGDARELRLNLWFETDFHSVSLTPPDPSDNRRNFLQPRRQRFSALLRLS
jgi:hypothetical protein